MGKLRTGLSVEMGHLDHYLRQKEGQAKEMQHLNNTNIKPTLTKNEIQTVMRDTKKGEKQKKKILVKMLKKYLDGKYNKEDPDFD